MGEGTGPAGIPVRMGDSVFSDLAADLRAWRPGRVILVADEHTYQAAGQPVEAAAAEAGVPLEKAIFPGQPWAAANEASIARVLLALDGRESLLAAVGSGTITDITRFVAFQARLPFLSVPTAASVDAYASYTASVTFGRVKYSIEAKPPQAIYAHLPTLRAAPGRMSASGFSDMIAKYTALADWKLAHVLAGDAYDPGAARRAEEALQACARQAAAVRAASPAGIAVLFDSLLVSGGCMAAVKSSRPAAGSEHSLAHYWEITHQQRGLPETLHGEKTGAAAVITAGLYEALRCLSRPEAARRLARFRPPNPAAEARRLQDALGPLAGAVAANRASFLGRLGSRVEQVKASLLAHWDEVQAIATAVPPAEALAGLLESAGSLSRPDQIHVRPEEVREALATAMYIRDRLTILEINRMLGMI